MVVNLDWISRPKTVSLFKSAVKTAETKMTLGSLD